MVYASAYVTAITANKLIQIPVYTASLATQESARAVNSTKAATPFDSLALNFISVKNQGGLGGLAAFDNVGSYFGSWIALLSWYLVLCVGQMLVLDFKLLVKERGGDKIELKTLLKVPHSSQLSTVTVQIDAGSERLYQQCGHYVMNLLSSFTSVPVCQVRCLDCVIAAGNYCTANFSYLLLLSSLQFFNASAAWNILEPGNYLDAQQGLFDFNMFYVMILYFFLAFGFCACMIECCANFNTWCMERVWGFEPQVAGERSGMLSTSMMGCWGWFCGIALTMSQQVLLTHKYLDIYVYASAWIAGSFLVLAFFLLTLFLFRTGKAQAFTPNLILRKSTSGIALS